MKIVQIVSHEQRIVGLSEDGELYYLYGSVEGTANWRKVKKGLIDTTDFNM